MTIVNDHGLLLEDGRCLGHLMHFKDRGTYEPSKGLVDISKEDAEKHNDLLDQAMLNDGCEVGQCGTFYLSKDDKKYVVKTFTGKLVSDKVTKHGAVITFRRETPDGSVRVFRGREQKDADCFNFRRIE